MSRIERIAFRAHWWAFAVAACALILAACTVPGATPRGVAGAPATGLSITPGAPAAGATAVPTAAVAAPRTDMPGPKLTLRPTPKPLSTPSPLPRSVLASCPVSLPNLTVSPDDYYISVENGYGNPERTMFIGLWQGGKVFFCPNCSADLSPDGSLAMKFWFYRTIPGEVVIEGRRLDQPGPLAHLATLRGPADGYGEVGFHPAGLAFPGQGCWEVTARIGEAEMTFVTLVVWIPFGRPWPAWLPEGVVYEEADLSGYPEAFGLLYRTADGGRVVAETSTNPWEDTDLAYAPEPVTVNGEPGTCSRGVGSAANSGALTWSSGGLYYRIRYDGLELGCGDLLRAAGQDSP